MPEEFDGHRTHEDDWKCYNNFREGKFCKSLNFNCDTDPGKYWDDTEDRISIINPSNEDIKNVTILTMAKKEKKLRLTKFPMHC